MNESALLKTVLSNDRLVDMTVVPMDKEGIVAAMDSCVEFDDDEDDDGAAAAVKG
jgi:hypothetical protein